MIFSILHCIFAKVNEVNNGDQTKNRRLQASYHIFIYGKDTAVFQHLQQLIDFMKQSQKLSDLLGVICVAFVFAGCVVGHDGGVTIWNIACLALAGLFGWLSKQTEVLK